MIIKLKKQFLNKTWVKVLSNLFWGIIFILSFGLEGWLLSSLISPFFGDLKVSGSFTLLKKPDDWVLLAITNISMFVGLYLIKQMIKYSQFVRVTKKKPEFWPLFFGVFGWMLTASSFLGIFAESSYMTTSQITAAFIKKVAANTLLNYIVGYITMVCIIVIMLWLSRNWIELNFWYVGLVILPPLIYIRQLVILQINWQRFLNTKSTTYDMLAKLFTVAHAKGNISIDISLMNGAVEPALITSWTGLFILIMMGGIICVNNIKRKTQQKIKEKVEK